MRMSPQNFHALLAKKKNTGLFQRDYIAPTRRVRGKMNKNEARYSNYLHRKQISGEIIEWRFEPIKFRLADNTYLEPDFLIVYPDRIAIHDAKGRKKKKNANGEIVESFWCEEDAMIKMKVVAEIFPWFEWAIVWELSNGEWGKKEL